MDAILFTKNGEGRNFEFFDSVRPFSFSCIRIIMRDFSACSPLPCIASGCWLVYDACSASILVVSVVGMIIRPFVVVQWQDTYMGYIFR